jgi:hypothetical protein
MSLLNRPITQHELMLYGRQGKAASKTDRTKIADSPDGRDHSGVMRRVIPAAVLSSFVLVILNWVLIQWALP